MKRRNPKNISGLMIIVGLIIVVGWLTAPGSFAQTSAQSQGVTPDSVKIGLFAPTTGPIALYGKAMYLAMAIYQEAGPIHGRKIVVVPEDSGCDPVKGIAAVKKLIYDEKVFAIHGGMCSNVCLAAKKELIQSGIPYMVMGAANHLITEPLEKNLFTPVFTSIIVGRQMVDFAMSKPGAKKIAIINHTDEWGKGFHEPILAWLKEKYKMTPVADETVERGGPDATPQILKIKSTNPDVVIAATYVEATSTILRDSYKLGLRVPIVGSPACAADEQFNRVRNPEATKQYFAPYYFKYPMDHPLMLKYAAMLDKHYPKVGFEHAAGLGIAGALVNIEALKRAGRDLTWEKFISALESLKNFDPPDYPMAAPVTFSATDHQGMEKVAWGVMTTQGKMRVVFDWQDFVKQ